MTPQENEESRSGRGFGFTQGSWWISMLVIAAAASRVLTIFQPGAEDKHH